MISQAQLILVVARRLTAWQPLLDWVNQHQAQPLKIFVGEDASNPPGAKDAPYITLTPPLSPYDLGTAAETRDAGFECDWGIVDNTGFTADDSDDAVQVQQGLLLADEMGHHIIDCLTDALGDGMTTAEYSLDCSRPPLCQGGVSVIYSDETGLSYEPQQP
jgi:hypothetical protein